MKYSGNPGYLPKKDLILGKKTSDNTVQRPINGFKLKSQSDSNGQCSTTLNDVDSTND